MISSKLLLAIFGFALVFSAVRAEDAADGEVHEEDEIGGASKDAAVSFHFTYPIDANVNKGKLSHSMSLTISLHVVDVRRSELIFTHVYESFAEVFAGKPIKFLIGFKNGGEKGEIFFYYFSINSFIFYGIF